MHKFVTFKPYDLDVNPEVKHIARLGLMDTPLQIETNDLRLIDIAQDAFRHYPVLNNDSDDPLRMRLLVHDIQETAFSATKPIYRAQEHLFSLTIDPYNFFVVDLQRGFSYAYISPEACRHPSIVRYQIIEAMALSMLCFRHQLVTVHAACVVKDGLSILIAGKSGKGKSTLAYACVRRGYRCLAEDAVYLSHTPQGLILQGLPWKLHLLPESAKLFPELKTQAAEPHPNGENKRIIDLERWYPGSTLYRAEPGLFVVLDRGVGAVPEARPTSQASALSLAEFVLPLGVSPTAEIKRMPQRLTKHSFQLTGEGSPDQFVDALDQLVAAFKAGEQH